MSARMGLLAQLSLRMDAIPAHQLIREYRAEVLHTTPLFLAEYDGAESEVHMTLEDARAMCDDIAKADSNGQCWDWSRNEDGVYVQFWTHEDDDRPLHMTGGTVTEIRVQRPEAEQGEQASVCQCGRSPDPGECNPCPFGSSGLHCACACESSEKGTREGESTQARQSADRLAAFIGGARLGRTGGDR